MQAHSKLNKETAHSKVDKEMRTYKEMRRITRKCVE